MSPSDFFFLNPSVDDHGESDSDHDDPDNNKPEKNKMALSIDDFIAGVAAQMDEGKDEIAVG